jgi:hypothetical protein
MKIGKPFKNPKVPIRVLKERASHQYQFFGYNGFIGRSPCRSTVTKLTPEDVLNRADMCPSEGWRFCNLVDGEGNVLDSMSVEKAWSHRIRNIYRKIALCSKDVPEIRGATC